MLEFGQGERWR